MREQKRRKDRKHGWVRMIGRTKEKKTEEQPKKRKK